MRWGQGVRFVFRVALALGLASTLDLARAAYTLPPPLFRQLGTSDNLYGTPCNTINNGSFQLTATTGNLSDGCAPRYIPNMYCNWTIKLPGNPPPSVTLETTRFALETNYDFVNVTDGYQLLGTFTGNTLPPRVVSTTGELHVRFTSDATSHNRGFGFNDSTTGFEAHYYTESCPNGCSGHGVCQSAKTSPSEIGTGHRCLCNDGYFGGDCSATRCKPPTRTAES